MLAIMGLSNLQAHATYTVSDTAEHQLYRFCCVGWGCYYPVLASTPVMYLAQNMCALKLLLQQQLVHTQHVPASDICNAWAA
jgi:hypothetical protein